MKKSIRFSLTGLALVGAVAAAAPFVRSRERQSLDDDARARAPGQFVRLSHGQTHYQIAGPNDGPVVVLVHGVSVPSYVWDPTVEALTEAGFRVLRYDLWGRGYSDRPEAAVHDDDLFESQLRELVTALGVQMPIDLVGLSMGGAVVAAFAARNPDLVRKVVLIDPYTERVDVGPLRLPLLGEYLAATVVIPSLPQRQQEYFFRPDRFPDWPERFQEQMRYKGFGRAILSTARHFNSQDPRPHFAALRGKPVLLIWGAEDRTFPLAKGETLRQLIEPEFLVVDSAGHLPHVERPEVVNPALLGFLRQ